MVGLARQHPAQPAVRLPPNWAAACHASAVGSFDAMCAMIAAGMGVGIMPAPPRCPTWTPRLTARRWTLGRAPSGIYAAADGGFLLLRRGCLRTRRRRLAPSDISLEYLYANLW